MKFKNNGMGECIVLKKSNTAYSLVYAYESNTFVIAYNINEDTGSWEHGSYYDANLDLALENFNNKVNEINSYKDINER